MDRLETPADFKRQAYAYVFTFQYGQIRNFKPPALFLLVIRIYIPVWIDQKLFLSSRSSPLLIYLHSSMDRLETFIHFPHPTQMPSFTFQYGQIRNIVHFFYFFSQSFIYIPVWIDQKREKNRKRHNKQLYLHSSMDRLETLPALSSQSIYILFTFQYGQIRNCFFYCQQYHMIVIYIPVWIDQKLQISLYIKIRYIHLHSSMDRLETFVYCIFIQLSCEFTFQYGQIRNKNER